ncbi:MAG: SMC-Scp complex subunit ScpB [Gemmatimonadetes bacterium]|nr:SMC-Scp complex subunit ScpB [Gemmatimonadota bacterium]
MVEALLFAADEPITARRLAGLIENASPAMVEDMIRELNADYIRERRAFRVQPVAGGYQFVTRAAFAPWIRRLHASAGEPRLSQAALETLAIVAYKQPVTRLELEAIRGVSVDGVLRTLIDRDLVTIAGRAESLGRPLLYGTTSHFLQYFGLPGLEALPRPEELQVLFADRERQDAAGAETGDDSGTPQ